MTTSLSSINGRAPVWRRALFVYGACTALFAAISVWQLSLITLPKIILPLGLMLVPTIVQASYLAQLKEQEVSPLVQVFGRWTVIFVAMFTAYFLYRDFEVTVTALRECSVAVAIYAFVLTIATARVERRKRVTVFFSSTKGYEFHRLAL